MPLVAIAYPSRLLSYVSRTNTPYRDTSAAALGEDPNVDDVHGRRLIVYFVENPDLTGV
jgi:hypothetical protein